MGRYVTLSQGSGGKETKELLEQLFFSSLPHDMKSTLGGLGIDYPDDAAAIRVAEGYIVVTVDSYTVSPLSFPGGNIGSLAATGTINDVLMLGGKPLAALDSIVAEEGLPRSVLDEVVASMIKVFTEEKVPVIGGDLKVMPKGQIDNIVITTVGLGTAERLIIDKNLKVGDRIIVSGDIAEHGAAILALQHSIAPQESTLKSDAKPLTELMLPLIGEFGDAIHAARDPTRGGLAMLLNDWAKESNTLITIDESLIPLRDVVKNYTNMLGMNPLDLASEGVVVLGVEKDSSEDILQFMKKQGFDRASIVGEVRRKENDSTLVLVRTYVGGLRDRKSVV
jgi:hydrogenase expression/formation protein HypE